MSRVFLLLFFINYVNISKQNKLYSFRPNSRHLEVNKGEDFYIGFEENKSETIFDHCYIESDTIKTDYAINKRIYTSRNYKRKQYDNGFTPLDGTGICAFIFHKVNERTPKKWIIKAYDNKTKTNATEEVTLVFYYNMPLFKDKLVALPTSSVTNFFSSDTVKFKKCTLMFNNISINLDLNKIEANNYNNIFKSRLFSLGEGKCGYKINNLVVEDSRDLTLYATDYNDKKYRSTSNLYIRKLDNLSNRTMEVYIGSTVSVICGKKSDTSANSDQKFCYLYNPNGDLVSSEHMCYYQLDVVTTEDLGIWKCIVGYDFTMDTLDFTTELIEKKPESVTTFQEDSQNYYIIGCQLVNFHRYNLNYCKFTRPDGKIFTVKNRESSRNYNSFTTDLNQGKCSIEILKPLRNEDKGSWKCEAILSYNEIPGGFIIVEKPTIFSYKKTIKKNVRLGESLSLNCIVPFSSDFCYIIAPNGTQFKPTNHYQISVGVCSFKIDKVTTTDNGTWICSIAQKNGIPDEMIKIEVSIIDIKILHSNMVALENQNVELSCNTNGIPIEYCRFVSPSNISYSLRNDNSSHNGISYMGRGLKYGDCGMRIYNIQLKDHGQWSCHISSGKNNYKTNIDLNVKLQLVVKPRFGLIDILGVSFGVIVVVTAVLAFLYYSCFRRKQCRKNNSVHYSATSIASSADENEPSTTRENPMYATYRRQGYAVTE